MGKNIKHISLVKKGMILLHVFYWELYSIRILALQCKYQTSGIDWYKKIWF